MIVSSFLKAFRDLKLIFRYILEFKEDEQVISELLMTLSALIVRNEYCKTVQDAGGVDFVLNVLKNYKTNEV